ncbi:hypothetical protein IH992_04070 [Candidatus Poribacteria bacterium]|nr:hypothetical protein [Candidatus Poribacteria bacterium]
MTAFIPSPKKVSLPAGTERLMARWVEIDGQNQLADFWCNLQTKKAWFIWKGVHNGRQGTFINDDVKCTDDCCK